MAILIADSKSTMLGVEVCKYLLTEHNPNHISMPTIDIGNVEGITIHNTDWIETASGTTPSEQYTRATVNGNMRDVRVHFYTDDVRAWQNLPLTLSGWHAADGGGKGNRKTIAIECIMSGAYNDADKKSEDNAARLCAALLKQFNLGIDKLYTHTHWLNVLNGRTGSVDELNTRKGNFKYCPIYILPHWDAFKAKVAGYLAGLQTPVAPQPANPIPANASKSAFKIGDTVYLNAGAVDVYGTKASSLYAGADNPLTVKSVSGSVCTLYKGNTPMYKIDSSQLRAGVAAVAPKFVPGSSRVKLKPGATWWGTRTAPPSWVFKSTYYLQEWNTATGRAVIGTTARCQSGTVTGAVDIAFLQLV
jgi:N-acetylmuramoyl-L-alanine amidase CwlA